MVMNILGVPWYVVSGVMFGNICVFNRHRNLRYYLTLREYSLPLVSAVQIPVELHVVRIPTTFNLVWLSVNFLFSILTDKSPHARQ